MDTYEKKYKELVGKIEKAYLYAQTDSTKAVLEEIRPELIESEDENIKKEIINYFQCQSRDEPTRKDIHNKWLAWLEKQGSQQPTIIWHSVSEEPEEMKELFCEWESDDATWHDVAFYDEESKTFRHAKMPINVTKWVYVDELLERQGEQKPFDYESANIQQKDYAEQKPAEEYNITGIGSKHAEGKLGEMVKNLKLTEKFKVGDWIIDVQGVSANQIIGYEDDSYYIKTSCSEFYLPMKLAEKNYRLWTIQDAKDGDVLVTKVKEQPFIFKGLLDEFHPKYPVAYCGLDFKNNFITAGGVSWWTAEEVKPSTKEQRDTLMRAMADAGYTFDFDKKELKKIEPTGELPMS